VTAAAGLTIGWARVGVSLEKVWPHQCHRCLARGHIGRWCPSVIDRGRCCLKCGESGHLIGRCVSAPRCPICVERGHQADHRPGDPSVCTLVPPGAERKERSPREGTGESTSLGPREGSEGVGRRDRGASGLEGDSSLPGAEAPFSLDPGEESGEVSRGPLAGSGSPFLGRGGRSGPVGGYGCLLSLYRNGGGVRGGARTRCEKKGPGDKDVRGPLSTTMKVVGGEDSAAKQKKKQGVTKGGRSGRSD